MLLNQGDTNTKTNYRGIVMNMKSPKPRKGKHLFIRVVLLVCILGFIGSGIFVLWASQLKMPDFSSFTDRKIEQSTKIYDRTGTTVLYSVGSDIRRSVVPYENISRYIKNATVAIEDKNFYQHHGIEPLSILRALFTDLLHAKAAQGGSTITQQVVKNTILTTNKSLSRKFMEAILAIKLEQKMSKDEILGLYLNESPYGGTIYGVEEASQAYFGKSANDVTLAEAAYLAALPNAPSYYSPYGNHVNELETRKNLVLTEMLKLGFITKDEETAAMGEKVTFSREEERGLKAPHFVMYVLDYLEKTYGRDALETDGLKVITTLDWNLQQKAEAIVADYGARNEKTYNAKNAGMIALDPNNGDILVMVGSRDYFDTTHQGNFNTTLSHRQPGSSFKPIVYATAFTKGYTPDTVVFDVPTNFSTNCDADGNPLSPSIQKDSCYTPQNYDGKYRGPISLRNALAQSINIPAVKLLYLVGLKDALAQAHAMGIKSLDTPDQYGLTLVLGGGEVSLLDLSSAYGVFATEGIHHDPTPIVRIEDLSGTILENHSTAAEDVLPAQSARLISSVLSDNVARTPLYGPSSPLYFPGRDVAAKTGTTNDYKDAWVIGYTPSFVLGAWVGNNDNTPMEKKVAGFLVAPMWNALFTEALKTLPDERFTPPDPIDQSIKPVLRGIWQDPAGGAHTILQYINKADPLGPAPVNPAADPQYSLWETAVQKWLASGGVVNNNNVSGGQSTNTAVFTSPVSGSVYRSTDMITARVSTSGEVLRVEYSLDGALISTVSNSPFDFSFEPSNFSNAGQNNTLSATIYLSNGTQLGAQTSFTVTN